MPADKLTFRLLDPAVPSPRQGYLTFWRALSPNSGYVANSVIERIDTGVALSVPQGVTLEFTPLPSHLDRGVQVHPQTHRGPCELPRVVLVVHNLANATIKFDPGEPLVAVHAYKSPVTAAWHEYEDTPPLREPEPAYQ